MDDSSEPRETGSGTAGQPGVGGQSSGSSSGPVYEHDPESPEGKIERARAESFPGGVPEDADVGTGRQKGQGLPPGSAGRGEDTPQTPVT